MKKTAFVLFLAAILVFAFAASALADTTSGEIATDGRYEWDPAAPNNNPPTPHKGYAYNTTKCLVCHAVHKAANDGEVLLGATVASACNYCHVDVDGISTKLVYGGDGAIGTDSGASGPNGHQISCTLCHAVHGANTVNQSALSSAILKADIGTPQLGPGDGSDWNLDSGSELGALSAYCTQCHPYYTGDYAAADQRGDVTDPFHAGSLFNSHIMTDNYADYVPGNGATHVGTADTADTNVAVAYASSAYCTSCHDAGRNVPFVSNDSFPHETLGARFMKSAEYVGATALNATVANEDGVCLKCHRGTATTGVGVDF